MVHLGNTIECSRKIGAAEEGHTAKTLKHVFGGHPRVGRNYREPKK